MALTENKHIINWVQEMAALCKSESIVWIDGSETQLEELRQEGFRTGELIKLIDELLSLAMEEKA